MSGHRLDGSTVARFGFFVGNEARLPFDFHEVIAAIAPRAAMIAEPTNSASMNRGTMRGVPRSLGSAGCESTGRLL
jgi:hypothetical protein